MRLFVLIALTVGVLAQASKMPSTWKEFKSLYNNDYSQLYQQYVNTFHKSHDVTTFERHFQTFRSRVATIWTFNEQDGHSYRKGINGFTDLSDEERQQYVMKDTKANKQRVPQAGRKEGMAVSSSTPKSKPLLGAGDSKVCDLRPFMTSVKDQGSCGSCWAFGTIAAAEASHQLWSMTDASGNAVPSSYNNAWQLSEQTIIECCGAQYDSNGCGGGGVQGPLQCAVDMEVLTSKVANPYKASTANTTCSVYGTQAAAAVESWYEPCANGDETCVKSYIGGDLCVNFYATALKTSIEVISSFYDYESGVYSDPNCPDDIHNHAVAIVGWGTNAAGVDYWIVRNSWGPSWGDNGYILMERGSNMCCIACENLFFQ